MEPAGLVVGQLVAAAEVVVELPEEELAVAEELSSAGLEPIDPGSVA